MANSFPVIFASAILGILAANTWWQIPLMPATLGAGGAAMLLYRRARRTAVTN